MLIFNLRRILAMRGIDKPMGFLLRKGFLRATAANLANNRAVQIKTAHLEKLCRELNCAPNDLFEWKPDAAAPLAENHPLNGLIRETDEFVISRIVKDIPIERLERAKELLTQLKDEA